MWKVFFYSVYIYWISFSLPMSVSVILECIYTESAGECISSSYAIVDLRVKGVDMIITTRVLVLHPDETFYGIRGHREIVLGVYDDGMSYETNKEEAN